MDAQQLAAKVTQLESRVATLEDEGKIIKGEVKQVLTEIRSAVLARENPFDGSAPGTVPVEPFGPRVEQPRTEAPTPPVAAPPPHAVEPQPVVEESHAPTPLRPHAPARPQTAPVAPERPHWTLLTISALTAWAEDATRRLGALRLEILLDLCEASGHISPEARKALNRITELDLPEPASPPSTNETAAILRELDALISEEEPSIATRRAA